MQNVCLMYRFIPLPDYVLHCSYTFDGTYDENTQQKFFYEDCCFQLVENVLEGFNGTVFAYGQTGCGKSWTMQGPADTSDPELKGVIPNSFSHIFDTVKASTEVEYLIHVSYLEIYNEEIKDLLVDPKKVDKKKGVLKCDVKEDPQKGVFVKNLTDVMVKDEQELQKVLDQGVALRTVAETKMNDNSSRSHSIFSIVIEMSSQDQHTGKELIRVGKLNLVDLAGSERQKKTGASGAVLKEGAKINLSLSALGNVISALSDPKAKGHVPYRDSKLTRLLQDSLGGNTKTLMVAAISPADYNYDETLSTLRYANRAKNIKNKPTINEDPKDTMMRELREQVEELKRLLAAGGAPAPAAQVGHGGDGRRGARAGGDVVASGNQNNEELDAIMKEKEQMGEALAEERRRAEEMERKMQELQGKLVGHASSFTLQNSGEFKSGADGSLEGVGQPVEVLSEEQIEAAKRLKERRKEAKRKREAKRKAQVERAQADRAAMEEELEDLRISAQGALGEAAQSTEDVKEEARRKLVKLKRRYEKKVAASRAEVDDIIEEASFQRNQLMESLREQEKDCRLYEAICLAVLSEQDLQKLVNKARWDEEDEYWVVPFTKRKSFDGFEGSLAGAPQAGGMVPSSLGGNTNGNGNGGQQRRGSRDELLGGMNIPHGTNPKTGSRLPVGGHDSSNNSNNPTFEDDFGEITFQNGSSFADIHGSSVASMGGGSVMGDIVDMGTQQVLPASINGQAGDGGSMLPNVNNRGGVAGGAGGGLPAVGGHGSGGNMSRDSSKKQLSAEEREVRQKKKEAKARRRAQKEAARVEKMKAEQANLMYSDEAGTGEQAGGTLEWDWAGGSSAGADPSDNPQYSDDEDFEVEEPAMPAPRGPHRRGDAGVIAPAIASKGGMGDRKAPKKSGGGTILPAL